jgi:hypothetical protein
MRCRECAAEVAVTARVCSGCGAPIVGQPPVVADTVVADTVVGAVSDAAGKAVPDGVAGQALPEPYVPGSGDTVPAELRLVLSGYVGIACGLFAGAMACATAFAFHFRLDGPDYGLLFSLAVGVFAGAAVAGAGAGAVAAVRGIRFSRMLRRPSDPRTATVMASKRGGRTLILDIPRDGTGRGDQSLSEVRLALWPKAGMLVPGETVNVYGGPGGESPLLISSPRWGRAFLGTVKSQSALQPRLLDEKVSGATLVEWAAWAASTTFSSTGLRFGYDKREVDAFRRAVRGTFLGGAVFWVSTPPVRSDDLHGGQFSTHRPGYDKTQVDAFLEAAGIRLAAMESTDRPAGPLVSGAILVGWAEWADATTFEAAGSYDAAKVDAFREEIRDTASGPASQRPTRYGPSWTSCRHLDRLCRRRHRPCPQRSRSSSWANFGTRACSRMRSSTPRRRNFSTACEASGRNRARGSHPKKILADKTDARDLRDPGCVWRL